MQVLTNIVFKELTDRIEHKKTRLDLISINRRFLKVLFFQIKFMVLIT